MAINFTISDVHSTFTAEFSHLADKFVIKELTFNESETTKNPDVVRGGVYVWWKKNQVIKVGRSLENTRKRALEHIRDNTGKQMADLKNDPGVRLILFNLKEENDIHWAFALEDFFERKLEPAVEAKRRG